MALLHLSFPLDRKKTHWASDIWTKQASRNILWKQGTTHPAKKSHYLTGKSTSERLRRLSWTPCLTLLVFDLMSWTFCCHILVILSLSLTQVSLRLLSFSRIILSTFFRSSAAFLILSLARPWRPWDQRRRSRSSHDSETRCWLPLQHSPELDCTVHCNSSRKNMVWCVLMFGTSNMRAMASNGKQRQWQVGLSEFQWYVRKKTSLKARRHKRACGTSKSLLPTELQRCGLCSSAALEIPYEWRCSSLGTSINREPLRQISKPNGLTEYQAIGWYMTNIQIFETTNQRETIKFHHLCEFLRFESVFWPSQSSPCLWEPSLQIAQAITVYRSILQPVFGETCSVLREPCSGNRLRLFHELWNLALHGATPKKCPQDFALAAHFAWNTWETLGLWVARGKNQLVPELGSFAPDLSLHL